MIKISLSAVDTVSSKTTAPKARVLSPNAIVIASDTDICLFSADIQLTKQ